MKNDDRKSGRRIDEEIDLRLDDLLGKLGSVFQEALQRLDAGGVAEVLKERSFDSAHGPIRASAGIRVRTAGHSRSAPEPRQSGRNLTQPVNQAKADASPVREIVATIFSEPGHWSLVADLPGVSRDDVKLSLNSGELMIEAVARGRHFRGNFSVPDWIVQDAIVVSAQNGVVELSTAQPRQSE